MPNFLSLSPQSSALTLSVTTVPSLLALPSPSDALPAFWKLKQHYAAAQSFVSLASGALLLTAYGLSPRFARHPYLLWMTLSVGVGGFALPRLIPSRSLDILNEAELAEEGRGRTGQEMRINGEVVRESMDGWSRVLAWQSLAWGIGWAAGTVGLWGDGY